MKNAKYLSDDFPACPIWLAGGGADDEYTDFLPDYELKKGVDYLLRIAADSDYSVYAGDKLAGFGQYPDYPSRVIYDDIPITADSDCRLLITAWHCGAESQTYIRHTAYAAFCLFENGKPVYASSEKTLSRLCHGYVQHKPYYITVQMGLGFGLDGRTSPVAAAPSEVRDIGCVTVHKRPNRRLVFGEIIRGHEVRSGRYSSGGDTDAAIYMRDAVLDPGNGGQGSYYLFDLGRESVGFPEISFSCAADARVCVGWGEHIIDGMCRAYCGGRRFAFEYSAHAGENRIFPVMRRIGCRYMQIFIEGNPSDVKLDFHTVIYPVKELRSRLTGLRRLIYDTSVHTLRCSMHDHYEDCPWREQALYTLDSRNQMIAGYYVFEDGNREMVRASLDLISRGVRPDGLLTLCYPAGRDYPIPFYTLAYFIQMNEYVRFSHDTDFLKEKLPVLRGLMKTVLSRMTDGGRFDGLVPRWDDSQRVFWNFYEWSPGMDGHSRLGEKVYDAPFNAVLVLSLRAFSELLRAAGEPDEANTHLDTAERVKKALRRVYARDDGFFASFRGDGYDGTPDEDARVSVLTQALILQAGAADGFDTAKMLEIVAKNGGYGSVPATLSMACFRYDALLMTDKARYAPVILAEIDRDCDYMLKDGATTFWETIEGARDFNGAGSLCHGWSAMAAYYYSILL